MASDVCTTGLPGSGGGGAPATTWGSGVRPLRTLGLHRDGDPRRSDLPLFTLRSYTVYDYRMSQGGALWVPYS